MQRPNSFFLQTNILNKGHMDSRSYEFKLPLILDHAFFNRISPAINSTMFRNFLSRFQHKPRVFCMLDYNGSKNMLIFENKLGQIPIELDMGRSLGGSMKKLQPQSPLLLEDSFELKLKVGYLTIYLGRCRVVQEKVSGNGLIKFHEVSLSEEDAKSDSSEEIARPRRKFAMEPLTEEENEVEVPRRAGKEKEELGRSMLSDEFFFPRKRVKREFLASREFEEDAGQNDKPQQLQKLKKVGKKTNEPEVLLLSGNEEKKSEEQPLGTPSCENSQKCSQPKCNSNKPMESDEQCPICFEGAFRTRTSLDSCKHQFCWSCIMDWLGRESTCPVCRKTVHRLSAKVDGKKIKQKIKEKRLADDLSEELSDGANWPEFCYVCNSSEHQETLLICDVCSSRGAHSHCLNPVLENIPQNIPWICDYCVHYGNYITSLPIAGIFRHNYRRNL